MQQYVIKKDSMDIESFESIYKSSGALQEQACSQDLKKDLISDTHTSLYRVKPEVKNPDEVKASRLVTQGLVKEMLRTSEYDKLHAMTQGDSTSSALGTLYLADRLLESIDEFSEELEDIEAKEKAMEQLADLAETLKDMGQIEESKKYKKQSEEKKQEKEQAQKNLEQEIDIDDLRQQAREACEQAQEEMETMQAACNAFGCNPDTNANMNIHSSFEVAKNFMESPKLRKIAELAGKFRTIADQKRTTKPNTTPEEIIDYEISGDIGRVIPQELGYIGTAFQPVFEKKFFEKSLVSYRMQGKEKSGQGPVIVCIDESGSMRGQREIWAKAYFLGLQALCAKDKRDIHYIAFGESVTRQEIFKHGQVSPIKICEMLSFFGGHGGTNFDKPLSCAIKAFQENKKMDLIFITDGYCDIARPTVAKIKSMKEQGLSVYTILIKSDAGEIFSPFADKIVEIWDCEVNTEANEIFEQI